MVNQETEPHPTLDYNPDRAFLPKPKAFELKAKCLFLSVNSIIQKQLLHNFQSPKFTMIPIIPTNMPSSSLPHPHVVVSHLKGLCNIRVKSRNRL